MYFRLHHYCKLVEGVKCGAIYNLQSGKVLSLNQGALQLLKECQSNALEDIIDVSASQDQPYLRFLDDLILKQLGSICITEPKQNCITEPAVEPRKLYFILLELTSQCNNTCLHCYTASSPSTNTKYVPHERWISIISEAYKSGARAIQFIGGEPLLYPQWRELVLKAREQNFESIEVFTNATLITDSDIEFFKTNNISIITSLYAGSDDIHDKVTQNPGSFDKTITNIRKMLAASVPVRISSVLMKENENESENIIRVCAELGLEGICPVAIRPVGRGDSEHQPKQQIKKYVKPPFHTEQYSFDQAHFYHNCLAGKITITYRGNAVPCMFARKQVCGNILTSSLDEILASEKLNQHWRTTKDQIKKCKDCEYRYACYDCSCRPITSSADSDESWPDCPIGCSYNPYTGEWADDISE